MGQVIKVGVQRLFRLAVKIGDEVSDQHHPALSVRRVGQHLCSIAGRKDQALGDGRLGGEALQRLLQPGIRKVKPLTDLDRKLSCG